jgi:hypothetical protein
MQQPSLGGRSGGSPRCHNLDAPPCVRSKIPLLRFGTSKNGAIERPDVTPRPGLVAIARHARDGTAPLVRLRFADKNESRSLTVWACSETAASSTITTNKRAERNMAFLPEAL